VPLAGVRQNGHDLPQFAQGHGISPSFTSARSSAARLQRGLVGQTPYDSTHKQQQRLLPISHPEDWGEASEEFRRGDYFKGTEA
jgi:hypothetical protein